MMQQYTNINQLTQQSLMDGQWYHYVIENAPQGNLKIGRTQNIVQRMRSLSGSNNGGNKIVKIAVSEPTYLYTLERLAHFHFDDYRIDGTEWFTGEDLTMDMICDYIDGLMQSDSYVLCNAVRKDFVAQHHNFVSVVSET